jgi:hypothetical protein
MLYAKAHSPLALRRFSAAIWPLFWEARPVSIMY